MRLYTKDYLNFKVFDDNGITIKEFCGVEPTKKALPGDEVHEDGSLKKRAKHPPIIGVLKLKNKIKYGFTSRNVPIHLFEPLNKAYPPILVSSDDKRGSNILALVQFEAWDQSKFPRGSLLKIIGDCGHIHAEAESLLLRYSPLNYPKKFEISPSYQTEISKRTILKGITFNIDPPGCEDVDDVFTVERVSQEPEEYIICISITDVAAAIEADSVLDIYASNVGQTLYPESQKPKHMLPPSIGIECLSLLPNKLRNCISLSIRWSPEKGILEKSLGLNALSVNKAFTYDEADTCHEWYMTVIKKLSEAVSECPLPSSHEWVETLMILYNYEVGQLLRSSNTGILRAHEAPDTEKLKRWTDIDPTLKTLSYSSAKYVPGHIDAYHWGLESESYAHASSPLRRYADLYNQRCLHTILRGETTDKTSMLLCANLNLLGKDAKAFERDTFFMNRLSQTTTNVEGIFVDYSKQKEKATIWISSWKRIIRVPCVFDSEFGIIKPRDGSEPIRLAIGTKVEISYMVNYESARWKERILFRIVKTL